MLYRREYPEALVEKEASLMYTVGIDLHKKRSRYVVMNQEGRVVLKQTIASTPAAFKEAFRGMEPETPVAMEATFNWYWAADVLEELGLEVHLANPHKVRLIAESTIKTDTVDAQVLAHLMRMNYLPESRITPREVRLVRERLRYRITLVALRTGLKCRIHAILSKAGVVVPQLRDLFGKTGRLWLEAVELEDHYRWNVGGYLRLIDAISEEIKQVEKWLASHTRNNLDVRLLCEIPGIGRFSAALILAETGGMGFFRDKRKLASFVGVVPGARNSDKKLRQTGLKKDSNRYIRWVLAEAVPKAVAVVPSWQRLYERICAGNPRRRTKAKVAVMHKIVGAIWRVLVTREPFDRLHNCPELVKRTASSALVTGPKKGRESD